MRSRENWIAVGIGVVIFILVASVSNLEKGLAAMLSFGVFVTIIQTKAETRKESLSDWRFWLVIFVFAVIHVIAITLIEFPELKAGLISFLFALADGFAMWFLIKWIERHVFR